MDTAGEAEQLTLSGVPGPRRRRPRGSGGPTASATREPVARVVVDRGPAHLDREFEYAVPETLSDTARPGVRVKVRFGGQDVDGFVVARCDTAEHEGTLTPLRRVVSPEVVLTAPVRALVEAVAQRYAGTTADVRRLAVPPRHARTEGEPWTTAGSEAAPEADAHSTEDVPAEDVLADDAHTAEIVRRWEDYGGGAAFLRHLAAGHAPRAVWDALPGPGALGWADAVAGAVTVARRAGRGSLVVVPTMAEVEELAAALDAAGVAQWTPGADDGWVRLVADEGPAARYRAFLAVSRGRADVVIGTRAAAFAPVRALGLAVCWDDSSHLHAEPRAPYPHTREVLALRSELEGAALLVGGYARSTACTRWVADGRAHAVRADRAVVRARTPRVSALTSVELASEGPAAAARLPGRAWRAIRDGLTRGPVLIQVPRAGYLPSTACARCRTPARCASCAGPLEVAGTGAAPQCRWCGRLAGGWRCPECSWQQLRSIRVGSDRTAEELGRAFPGATVRVSGASAAGGVLTQVPDRPALVVATPGAEPRAPSGYAATVLLDAAVVTGRVALDVAEQALRTWMTAAALTRPGPDGVVLLVGDGAPVPTQALVRWDPAGLAERELGERAELSLPPAVHMVSLEGPRRAVSDLLRVADLPAQSTVLGPRPLEADPRQETSSQATLLVPADEVGVRALVRSPWAVASTVAARLVTAQATRSARREPVVRVQVDPVEIT